jgi:hypothetical protein
MPSGQYLRATYNPATGTGEIVNLSTGQQVAVVRNGVVSPPARALPPPGETAAPPTGTGGVAGEPVLVPGQAGGAGGALPAVVAPPQPAALPPPGGSLIGPPVAALPGVPERPALPANPAVERELAEATAGLNKALAENGLAGDPLFANPDIRTARKLTTALTSWPKPITTSLRTRMLEWGREGCGGSPTEFANRVEYARGRYLELAARFGAEFESANPGATPGQVKTAGGRAAAAAMEADDGMRDLSVHLATDLATIGNASRSGVLPVSLPPGQVPDAVRGLPSLPYQSGTAEAYHARKHMKELPVGEQDWTNPVTGFAASLQETVRSGKLVQDQMEGTSRKLVYQREVDEITLEAIIYVRSDGSVVVGSYGNAKAVKKK